MSGFSQEAAVTLFLGFSGMGISWAVWVSVTTFKHAQEIALIKQEIKLITEQTKVLVEVQGVLVDIRNRLKIDFGEHS